MPAYVMQKHLGKTSVKWCFGCSHLGIEILNSTHCFKKKKDLESSFLITKFKITKNQSEENSARN
jgi:hypothetical protein